MQRSARGGGDAGYCCSAWTALRSTGGRCSSRRSPYVLFALISLFRQFGAVELNIALARFSWIGSGCCCSPAFWHNGPAKGGVCNRCPRAVGPSCQLLDRPAAHAAA
jgi:hypothetical protein